MVRGPLSPFSLPSPSPPTRPAPFLTPGPDGTTAGPHAVLCCQEAVRPAATPAIIEGLAEPGVGIVEVPDKDGHAVTSVGRLQAEGRRWVCKDGRDSGSVMRMVIKAWSRGFPGGAVVENLPANAGDTGSSPGLGRSHMPRSN